MLGLEGSVVVLVYMAAMVCIGFYFVSKTASFDDFYLAGRSLSFAVLMGTMAASLYGAGGTIAMAELGFGFGIGAWMGWSLPSHLPRIPMALWVGPKVNLLIKDNTLPDLFSRIYGKIASYIAGVLVLLRAMPFYEVVGLSIVCQAAWPLPPKALTVVAMVAVVMYTMLGGLWSVAVTDLVQFVVMAIGLSYVLPAAWRDVGGFAGLRSVLPAEYFAGFGGMPVGTILGLVIGSLGAYSDARFYQRFSAGKTPRDVRRSILSCLIFFLMYDCMFALVGMVAKVKYPTEAGGVAYLKTAFGYLNPVGQGVFVASLLAAIMSTVDSQLLIISGTITNDFYKRITGREISGQAGVMMSRIAVPVAATLAVMIAFQFQTVVSAFLFVAGGFASSTLVPMLGGLFWPLKITSFGGTASMLGGLATFLVLQAGKAAWGLAPAPWALLVSSALFIIGNLVGDDVRALRQEGL